MSIGYSHPLSWIEVDDFGPDRRLEAKKAAERESASREILETLALAYASVGGNCLLLELSGNGSAWLPRESPQDLPTERQVSANLAARWVVNNLPHPYWSAETQADYVCRYMTGDTKGMSGGKRGIRNMLADWVRQYEAGETDAARRDREEFAETERKARKDKAAADAFTSADNRFAALAALNR